MSQYHFIFHYQHKSPEGGTEKRELILLSFSGRETISELFDFELELKSDDIQLDEDGVINQTCSIEIYYANNTTPIRVIHGLINEFEDVNYFPDCTLYRARVVPRVWQLSYFETNEVYLNETIDQTLTVMLEEAGFLLGQDFRFELNRSPTYRAWPFRLQYNETHLDYLQRIIEREGIYYYFEHSHNADVMVFCDNNQSLPKIVHANEADKVTFQANSGVLIASGANTVNSIICKRHTLPKKVTLRDFNDETPSLDIRGKFVINKTGIGDINLYGLNITSPEEGQQLAEIHANAYLCRQKSYIGQGDVATMLAGHTFNLQHHPRAAFNELGYLLESIEHEGANLNQYQAIHPDDHSLVNYANNFTALSSEHQFAPKRQTLAPEINGTLNAIVDTEVDSGYAELDQFGRYKVKLPFDRKDRGVDGGKASHWVRMMQPYGGSGEGMHFPLRKGTRVLLGFIGGDPDRPFISGTINDSGEQQSIVTGDNQTNNMIKTASGNKIELEDKEGKNRIKLQTGDNQTYMHLGSPNHPGDGFVVMSTGIERKEVLGGKQITRVTKDKLNETDKTRDESNSHNSGVTTDDLSDEQGYFTFPIKSSMGDGANAVLGTFAAAAADFPIDGLMNRNIELSGYYLIERTLGDKYIFEQGNEYEFNSPGDKRFQFGADREIIMCQNDAALNTDYVKTATSIKENQNKNRDLTGANDLYTSLVDLLTKNVSGYQSFATNSALTEDDKTYWRSGVCLTLKQANDLLDNKCNFRIAEHNTFNIQKGNIFDFGGYWNYDMGNSYAEVHGKQGESNDDGTITPTEINKKYSGDIAEEAGPWWKEIKGKNLTIVQEGEEQVEKSYCNQYNYALGNKIEVHKGDVESQHYGNSYDYHDGNAYSKHNGNSYEEVNGNSESVFGKPGGGHSTVERYYGWQDSMMIAGSSEMQLGGASSLFLGAKNDISLAISNNVNMGVWTDISLGGKFTLDGAVELNACVVRTEAVAASKLETALSKIQMIIYDIETITNDIDNNLVSLKNVVYNIESGALKMIQ